MFARPIELYQGFTTEYEERKPIFIGLMLKYLCSFYCDGKSRLNK